jgi:hypothetical protein
VLVRRLPGAGIYADLFRELARRGVHRRGRRTLSARTLQQRLEAGDPFRFKLPKFLKPPKFVRKLVSSALPMVAGLIPGGSAVMSLIGGREGAGGAPESPAPELTLQPRMAGTLGENYRREQQRFAPPPEEVFEDEEDFEEDFEDFEDEGYQSEDEEDFY